MGRVRETATFLILGELIGDTAKAGGKKDAVGTKNP
jgi:hypothetical protein